MTLALHQHKPLIAGQAGWRAINWPWWLKRVPMALLAIPSAYGVGAFVHSAEVGGERVPVLVAIVAGGAFEAAYLGAIAMADHQHEDEDHWTTLLWWIVNLAAVAASVLSNLLFFSGGTYAGITPEVATHAIPLPVLGFFYGLLLHRTSAQAAKAALDEAEAEAAKVNCRFCGKECRNQAAEWSHYRTCPKHPKNSEE
jgi:hypothetical protein